MVVPLNIVTILDELFSTVDIRRTILVYGNCCHEDIACFVEKLIEKDYPLDTHKFYILDEDTFFSLDDDECINTDVLIGISVHNRSGIMEKCSISEKPKVVIMYDL